MNRAPALPALPETAQAERVPPLGREAFQRGWVQELPREDLPIHAIFGDGTPIPAESLDEVRRTALGAASLIPWRAGDLLLADNVLILHGRMPFRDPRKILVAMT